MSDRTLGCVAAALAFAAYLVFLVLRVGLNAPTGGAGDEPDYDSLAWELSRGRGYRVDYLDPEFRRPYDEAAPANDLYRLRSERQGKMTYRPPLFPAVVSLGNVAFGRQFWVMRLLNAAAMAACCGMAFLAARRVLGLTSAMALFVLFVIVDTRTRLYAHAFLTESFAAAEVALLFVVLAHGLRGQAWQTCVAGGLVGLMLLTRPMFLMWLPWLLLLVVVLDHQNEGTPWLKGLFVHGAAFVLAVVIVLAPWGARNCLVLGRFMPLGTQGAIELPAAWGDLAWKMKGEWRGAHAKDFAEPDPDTGRTLIERELHAADAGVAKAKDWVVNNPGKVLALIPMKIIREFTPKSWSQGVLLALAAIGAIWGGRIAADAVLFRRYLLIGLTFVGAQMLAVGLTWTVPESRFVVPLLAVEHFLAAAGVAVLIGGWHHRAEQVSVT